MTDENELLRNYGEALQPLVNQGLEQLPDEARARVYADVASNAAELRLITTMTPTFAVAAYLRYHGQEPIVLFSLGEYSANDVLH
ncbi:MAG: hypothetical protein KIT00_05450 [Rhodospirillales bacterium]|nr:hypothetical protein [Rhodospirillales bacterium]